MSKNMVSFSELTNQVHFLKDLILNDMIYDGDTSKETLVFSKHLYCTKFWFVRISWANKKRFILALLEDVKSAWTLSLILKSIWNCQNKDVVMSMVERVPYSCYDQIPLDNNRTAIPAEVLTQVMTNDRLWVLSLEPEQQALVLTELLSVSGGQIMREVLKRAQQIYEQYRIKQLQSIHDSVVISNDDKAKKEEPMQVPKNEAERQLQANLAQWNLTVKAICDNLKLEELELSFNDGSKKKIWKINRPKTEFTETLDKIQLLPSSIAKRILSYLPRAQLPEYAKVNKYWASLVDDLKQEFVTRQKIDADLEKLRALVALHQPEMEIEEEQTPSESTVISRKPQSIKTRISFKDQPCIMTFKEVTDQVQKVTAKKYTPLRNLAEVTERLDSRGAVDENLFNWCHSIAKYRKNMALIDEENRRKNEKTFLRKGASELLKNAGKKQIKEKEGVLQLGHIHFPCPLLKDHIDIPLDPPMFIDPVTMSKLHLKGDVSNYAVVNTGDKKSPRYSLWSKDFSKLYPVYKISSHQSPV